MDERSDERSAAEAREDAEKALIEARRARLRMGYWVAALQVERRENHWAERLRLAFEGDR
jgi:hypothetical protein